MSRFITVFFRSKVLLPVILVSVIILITLFFFIPYITEKNLIDTIVRNSKTSVEQIKATRAYYVDSVVGDVKKHAPNLEFSYDHAGTDGKIPLPTTIIHDLSNIFTKTTGVSYTLYSEFPFKNRENRVLTSGQKDALKYTKTHPDGLYVKKDMIDGKPVLRVAVTDYMTSNACVSCHNSHKERTWEEGKWSLGDKRGVLEVITPLSEELAANKQMRDYILYFISAMMVLLIFYYTIMLVRRENQLLNANDLLEKRVKEEVDRNLKQERQLVQQSRTAAMGEMMAAIIHQWKQPLNSISLANSVISLYMDLDNYDKNEFKKQTGVIESQISHMNNTMDDFRNFFKPSEKIEYKVEDSINNVLTLVGKVLAIQKVNIITAIEKDLKTEGYPNELNQVIINILNNSRDVIEERNPEIKDVVISTYKEDGYVYITIRDYAGGIPEEIIDRIFDAYFTTKDDDKGTGIGLDMSKTIIEKVDGEITVENIQAQIDSTNYKGAEFKIKLKAIEEE